MIHHMVGMRRMDHTGAAAGERHHGSFAGSAGRLVEAEQRGDEQRGGQRGQNESGAPAPELAPRGR
jgi:hypothetical protein